MLNYDLPLYRPPSEANSLIFQVTLGCSFNHCSFCSMYKTKQFVVRPFEAVRAEIEGVARIQGDARRVFLADGDALVCSVEHLSKVLDALHSNFPYLERVSSYALPSNILRRSVTELAALRARGLQMIYYGIESGSPEILKRITKGATPRSMLAGLNKAKEAGLEISATVVLGLGGRLLWKDHIDGTAELVNQLALDYLSTLQLYLERSVYNEFMDKFARRGGAFQPQDDLGILAEQTRLIANLDPAVPLVFRSNHASNALPLKGVLPRDKSSLLALLRAAQDGHVSLRPASVRGL